MSNDDRSNPPFAMLQNFVSLPDLMARVEGDHELLAELFAIFQEEFPDTLDVLHRVVNSGDLTEAAKTAHALKGMLANLSMKHGALLVAKIESASQAGDIPKSKKALAYFDSEMSSLLAVLTSLRAGTGE
jgi:HPt (histidine-containing phosphotransfer) domain-containing protein